MNYYNRKEELTQLAFIDEADSWEVDETGIYTNGEKFYVLTASGCSCFSGDEGEWDEKEFDSFEELRHFLLTEDLPRYNPSINGAKALIEEAEKLLQN